MVFSLNWKIKNKKIWFWINFFWKYQFSLFFSYTKFSFVSVFCRLSSVSLVIYLFICVLPPPLSFPKIFFDYSIEAYAIVSVLQKNNQFYTHTKVHMENERKARERKLGWFLRNWLIQLWRLANWKLVEHTGGWKFKWVSIVGLRQIPSGNPCSCS